MKGWGTAAMPFLPASSARVQPRARTHPPMDARARTCNSYTWTWLLARLRVAHLFTCSRILTHEVELRTETRISGGSQSEATSYKPLLKGGVYETTIVNSKLLSHKEIEKCQ